MFSLTNGTTELFIVSSDSNSNTLLVQLVLVNGSTEMQQNRVIDNVSLSNNEFHHIAVAVYDVQLTVTVNGVIKLQENLAFPVVNSESIVIGALNDGENRTLQGTILN